MNCEGCINNRCLDCKDGSMKITEVKRGEHKPSAWEKRWIKWAAKQKKAGA